MSEALSLPIITPLSLEQQKRQTAAMPDAEEIALLAQRQHRKSEYVYDSLRSRRSNSRSFLSCAHAMAQQKMERGELLPTNMLVVEAVYELQDRRPIIMAGGRLPGVALEYDAAGGILSLTLSEEQVSSNGIMSQCWRVSAFCDRDDDHRYIETKRSQDTGDFDDAYTTFSRPLRLADAYNLQSLLQAEPEVSSLPEVELHLVPPIN
jgi:hypothetical protein